MRHIGFPQVDGLSTDLWDLGHHTSSRILGLKLCSCKDAWASFGL